jgi:quercetin dioxygenase-like cupin family protein
MTAAHRELIALYPLGLSEREEAELVEIAAASAEVARELGVYREVAALLGLGVKPATPNGALRERVMASLRSPLFTEAEPGIWIHRGSDRDWSESPFRGVFVKRVAFDAMTSMATSLVRMEAGAEYPHHTHSAEEQCYVISGEVRLGTVVLRSGDFSKAVPGSHHGEVRSDDGCTLLIVSSAKDELD